MTQTEMQAVAQKTLVDFIKTLPDVPKISRDFIEELGAKYLLFITMNSVYLGLVNPASFRRERSRRDNIELQRAGRNHI